jgi:Zn-dependent protease with chaperone function
MNQHFSQTKRMMGIMRFIDLCPANEPWPTNGRPENQAKTPEPRIIYYANINNGMSEGFCIRKIVFQRMTISRFTSISAILVLAIGYFFVSPLCAQQLPKGAELLILEPLDIFDRFFGGDREEDEKMLAKIEVSPKEEEQLGQMAVRAYLNYLKEHKIKVLSRGKDVDYLQRLVETIRPFMTQADRYHKITVYIVESPRPDARSLPGGTLVFFRGLLDGAESEAAVVGVVGHELSHLDRNHLLINIRRMKFAEQTLSNQNNFSPEKFITATTAMSRLWSRPFRPEDERTADLDGARWAYKAGYDPREMIRVLAKIAQKEKNQPLALPSYFRTHPPAEDRSKAVQELYDELQKTTPAAQLYIGKENLRRRITRAEKKFEK